MIKKFLATLFVLLFSTPLLTAKPPIQTSITIENTYGGEIREYYQLGTTLSKYYRELRVKGDCLSACTILLETFSGEICVDENARLGFHRPFTIVDNKPVPVPASVLKEYLEWHRRTIREAIQEQGGLEEQIGDKMLFFQAKQFFPVCKITP